MTTKRVLSIAALLGLLVILVVPLAACSAFSSGPTTIQAKYVCSQTLMGHKVKAYCVTDSNENSYYLPYYLWFRTPVNSNEDLIPQHYWSNPGGTVSEDNIPAHEQSEISSIEHTDDDVHPEVVVDDGR